mgnify:CR=1 FL=1
MSEPTVLYDEHDALAVITLNQPDNLDALTNRYAGDIAVYDSPILGGARFTVTLPNARR